MLTDDTGLVVGLEIVAITGVVDIACVVVHKELRNSCEPLCMVESLCQIKHLLDELISNIALIAQH